MSTERPADEDLGRELSTAVVMFHQAVAEKLGLNATDLRSLEIIHRLGSVTAGQLAEETGLSTGAVTGVVDRLERAGHVRRERDSSDRRKVIIQVVPEAERDGEVATLFSGLQRAMAGQMREYGPAETKLITEFLRQTISILQEQTAQIAGESAVSSARV